MGSKSSSDSAPFVHAPARQEWVCDTANAFQVFCNVPLAAWNSREVHSLFQRLKPPATPLETLILKCFCADVLCRACETAVLDGRTGYALNILRATDSIRAGSDPLGVFEQLSVGSCRSPTTSDHALAGTLREEINEQLATRLTLRGLAAEHRVPVQRLNKSFRAVFGVSVLAYLRNQRVMQGLRLVTSGMKVEAAAHEVGFRSKKDFYRAVRSQTGLTPGQYRQKKTSSNDA